MTEAVRTEPKNKETTVETHDVVTMVEIRRDSCISELVCHHLEVVSNKPGKTSRISNSVTEKLRRERL